MLRYNSDHMPIILATSKLRRRERKRERVIRFEQMWLKEEGCEEIVAQTWGCDINNVKGKLSACLNSLDTWGTNVFGEVGKKVKE